MVYLLFHSNNKVGEFVETTSDPFGEGKLSLEKPFEQKVDKVGNFQGRTSCSKRGENVFVESVETGG